MQYLKSLTAKSVRCSFPTLTWYEPSGPFSLHSIVTVNIACERELCSFICVDPTDPETKYDKCQRTQFIYQVIATKITTVIPTCHKQQHQKVIPKFCPFRSYLFQIRVSSHKMAKSALFQDNMNNFFFCQMFFSLGEQTILPVAL